MDASQKRAYILLRYKLNIEPVQIHSELLETLGDKAPSIRTVYRWIERFRNEGESVEDKDRMGRPITETVQSNTDLVRGLIEGNPRISKSEIEDQTSLSQGTIHRILSDHLKMRKLASRWIPHFLTEEQRQKRVFFCQKNLKLIDEQKLRLCDIITGDESWIYHRKVGKKFSNSSWVAEGEKPLTLVRRSQFEPKTMISVFFKSTGPVLIHAVKKGSTIDNNYYIENCLKPLVGEMELQRPKTGVKNMKILHDNARPHTHKNVHNFLESQGIALIDHPPYSPDLAPCDFWLFDLIKFNLPYQVNEEDIELEITGMLKKIPKNEYLKTFEKWVDRMKFCIDNNGDYFEHKIK